MANSSREGALCSVQLVNWFQVIPACSTSCFNFKSCMSLLLAPWGALYLIPPRDIQCHPIQANPSTHSTTVLHPYMTERGLAKFQTFHQKNFGTLPILSSWSITRWSTDVGTLPRAALVLGINYRGYHGRGTTGILEGPKRRGERARMGKSSTDRLYWPTKSYIWPHI